MVLSIVRQDKRTGGSITEHIARKMCTVSTIKFK
jgi:hypothetical protein